MYLMYVDESGDIGLSGSPTRYFVLTGLVLHELRWRQTLDELIGFRRELKADFGLKLREEIHASPMLSKPGDLVRIPKHQRLEVLRRYADKLASMPDLSSIGVVIDKANKPTQYDVFDAAWKALIQRFENTLAHRNFPGPRNPDDMGMLFPDRSDEKKPFVLHPVSRCHGISSLPTSGAIGLHEEKIRSKLFWATLVHCLCTRLSERPLAHRSTIKKKGPLRAPVESY